MPAPRLITDDEWMKVRLRAAEEEYLSSAMVTTLPRTKEEAEQKWRACTEERDKAFRPIMNAESRR